MGVALTIWRSHRHWGCLFCGVLRHKQAHGEGSTDSVHVAMDRAERHAFSTAFDAHSMLLLSIAFAYGV